MDSEVQGWSGYGAPKYQRSCGSRWPTWLLGNRGTWHVSVAIPVLRQAYTCCKVAINILNNKGYNEGKWKIHYGEVKGRLRVPGKESSIQNKVSWQRRMGVAFRVRGEAGPKWVSLCVTHTSFNHNRACFVHNHSTSLNIHLMSPLAPLCSSLNASILPNSSHYLSISFVSAFLFVLVYLGKACRLRLEIQILTRNSFKTSLWLTAL